MKNKCEQHHSWTVAESEELYAIQSWGGSYFSIDDAGDVCVRPKGSARDCISMHGLVRDLVERGLDTPLLLRFSDILEDRILRINEAFQSAIAEYAYQGSYRGIFPIKVNQQRHVVEEIVNYGRSHGLGLEAGSKAELLIALAYHGDPDSLIVCNGFKDEDYVQLALYANKLGKPTMFVVDRIDEIYLCVAAAKGLQVLPRIGVRARLSSPGAGKWNESSGDRSKFGLGAEEIIEVVDFLRQNDLLHCLEMLHFHIGSQISEIGAIKDALREGSRIYAELCELGAPMGWIDVGGGLGVDYDGSQTSFHSSINYSLQEYANDVVSAVQDACDSRKLAHPYIVSESGRAIVAHHEVLVFDVLGTAAARSAGMSLTPQPDDHAMVHSFFEVWQQLTPQNMLESYHDLLQLKEEVQSLFKLGYLDLAGRARCERLFWSSSRRILDLAQAKGELPSELQALPRAVCDIYYCNFSVFQSLPDHWAVKQLFPMMPLQRLTEKPMRTAVLADLTCDSDGKMDCFIGKDNHADVIALHEPDGKDYYLGVFLVGAYQEVLGDLHNLFGDTNVVHVRMNGGRSPDLAKVVEGDSIREVLAYVQYDSEELISRLRQAGETALRTKRMGTQEVQELLKVYKNALNGQTYLQ